MGNSRTHKIAAAAMLVAIEIILSRFLSIPTPVVKISLSFMPLALLASLCGPLYSCAGAAMADFIGATLFPTGAYFPGYTLTAAMTGLTYGIFLRGKRDGWLPITAAVLVINLCWRLGLNSVWVQLTTGRAMAAFMAARVAKTFITMPVEVLLVRFTVKRLRPLADKFTS